MLPPFTEVLFHYINKMEKARSWRCAKDSYGMDTDFSTYFLKYFPSLFMSFLAFYFCCVCVWDTTSHGGRAIYSSQSVEESLKGCVPSTQGLGWKTLWRKNSVLGTPLKWPSQRGFWLWRALYVPRKCVPPLLLSVVGLPTFAPSSFARVAQKASEKKMASKLHGISQLVIIFLSLFCTLKKERVHTNELFKTCLYLMAIRAIH